MAMDLSNTVTNNDCRSYEIADSGFHSKYIVNIESAISDYVDLMLELL
jgi:hypothetical protein